MPLKGKVIILRFSAMGDVAMVASVLRELTAQNPEAEFVMVSRATFSAFFEDIPRLSFHAIQPKDKHKGVTGLYLLFKELSSYHPVAIADLHDNLRSRILSTFFRFKFIKVKRLDKGRKEKRELTRTHNKVFKQLKQTVERYADVFRNFGFSIKLSHKLTRDNRPLPESFMKLFGESTVPKIGISPFAQHRYKAYSFDKMEEVLEQLNRLNYQIFIFGGSEEEKKLGEKWEQRFGNVKNLIGKFTLSEELSIISQLNLMLSMDSAGMHMASLMGVPVVSIWGPTHPYAGFLGYGQLEEDCLQIAHEHRPSSIYGNKPCLCGDEPCIDLVSPSSVILKINERLSNG
ncbi:MAG: lipopolysaccharide heptosyltransferase family protein [Pedobacter sp.]|nr:MAG: lipopolysaccharide heptosyltransferase family protein [Pedobacter sp.]